MHIVIVGGGEVGFGLAQALAARHQVVIVDHAVEVADRFEKLDVEVVIGSGTSSDTLARAAVARAEVFIACSGLDEVNIVACGMANNIGSPQTICFVSREDFLHMSGKQDGLELFGINRVVWPEAQLAEDIERVVAIPGAIDAEEFAGGAVRLLEYRLDEGSPLVGQYLSNLQFPRGSLIVAVRRGEAFFIPHGDTLLTVGDKVVVMGTSAEMAEVQQRIMPGNAGAEQMVTIIGGGDVGQRLAERLDRLRNIKLRVIERDAARGAILAARLRRALVLNGDGTDLALLEWRSLLGAFEITLPSGLLTKMNQASERGGVLGTLLMGLTFSLTSFACVGPFVGTLLAGSVGRSSLEPVLGMATFAAGLSLPFFVLALFPSYLQRMPRSGGWLARVKIVLGFIILAAALKYISSIDQVLQWNILTRERFLAAWVVLFALPGFYLLGFLRMEGIRHDENTGVARALTGAAFLIFAISLIPGMFGAPLGELDSWVPLASESPLARSRGEAPETAWLKNDFEGAVAKAREGNKLVLVSFTGYACTNCHWMKANMFTRPEVAAALKGFVLVELYTDGTDAASEANQKLQESKFSTVAIPYYAIFDTDGRVVATFAGLTRKVPEYLAFLRSSTPTQAALNR